ncbi:MAG: hypothetical protein U0X20_19000 [Caldilineaceae bacterium]
MNLCKKTLCARTCRNAAATLLVLLFVLQGIIPQPAAAYTPAVGPAAGEYGAHAAGTGNIRAANPAHGWNINYGADGATQLAPRTDSGDSGSWQWRLTLAGYGYGSLVQLAAPPEVRVSGQRVTYSWDESVSEWWSNAAGGLEQGFTVRRPPAGGAAGKPLRLQMHITGDLLPVRKGAGILFLDQAGAPVFTYDKLHAWDAAGRVLPAQLALAGSTLSILVDDTAATYPVTIDPILQQALLKANNIGPNDQYGYAVAISGNTIAVGAPGEDSGATTVNGNGGDDSATDAGAVYVYTSSNNQWNLQAYIKAANAQAGDQFGYAVALAGDTLVVGAPGEDSSGAPADNSALGAGAAYVFVRSGGAWSQTAYLKASNANAGDGFGTAVAADTGVIAVGAPYEDSATSNPTDNTALDAGAAYMYQGSGATWMQQGYLKASNGGPGDRFGWSVGVHQQTVVVGAPYEDSMVTGVNAFAFDNAATDAGAAYIFALTGGWTQQAYVKATNTGAGDLFGWSVGVGSAGDGFSVVIGAPGEDSNATGVNGNPSNDAATDAGAAYTYRLNGVTWSSSGYLKAAIADPGDQFGWSVTAYGNWVVVGAPNEDGGGIGTAASPHNNSAPDAGAAYIFGRHIDDQGVLAWYAHDYEKASNTDPGDQFGRAVAVTGEWTEPAGIRLAVGAPFEDSANPGSPGYDNMAPGAGASYAFGWFLLYIYPAGTGTGTVTVTPYGFLQGTDTNISLAASPAASSTFDGWSGDCSGTGSCDLVMNSSKQVYATFNLKQYTVGLSVTPAQGGSVTGGGTVTHGSTVTATATANPGYVFVDWSEGGSPVSTSAEYSFTATGDRTLTATFTAIQYNIGAVTGGAGGAVSIEPPSGPYLYGTVVTATATANTGYSFVEWTDGGAPISTGAVYTFTVTGDHALSATFSPLSYSVSAETAGSGSGSVTLNPLGGVYGYGTVVTATATANTGSTFTGWSGDCGGAGDCVLTVDGSKSVTATFSAVPVDQQPHVAVAASASITRAIVGETTITYTYRVTNTGAVSLAVSAHDGRLGAVPLAIPLQPGQEAAGQLTYTPQLSDLPGPLANTAIFTATAAGGSVVLAQTVAVDLLVRAQGQTMYAGDSISLGSPYGGNFDLVVFEGDAPTDLFLSGVSAILPYTGEGSLDDMTNLLLGQGCPGAALCNTVSEITFDSNGGYTSGVIQGGPHVSGGDLYLPLINR